jgi:stage V sporulation protein SpoVS
MRQAVKRVEAVRRFLVDQGIELRRVTLEVMVAQD